MSQRYANNKHTINGFSVTIPMTRNSVDAIVMQTDLTIDTKTSMLLQIFGKKKFYSSTAMHWEKIDFFFSLSMNESKG